MIACVGIGTVTGVIFQKYSDYEHTLQSYRSGKRKKES